MARDTKPQKKLRRSVYDQYSLCLRFWGDLPLERIRKDLKMIPVAIHRRGDERQSKAMQKIEGRYFKDDFWIWSHDTYSYKEVERILASKLPRIAASRAIMSGLKRGTITFEARLARFPGTSKEPNEFYFYLKPEVIQLLAKLGSGFPFSSYP